MTRALAAALFACQLQIQASSVDSTARLLADSGFTGVVMIAHGPKILFNRFYGTAIRRDTEPTFWIGSMTKEFTAAAILRLAEQHRLTLGDPIGRFLRDAPAGKRLITIRQLLTHTSGIRGNYAASGKTTRALAVAAILAQPLDATPGARYRYMDDDYVLLAAIIEIASGSRWDSYVKGALLERAGLRHTSFWKGHDWGHKGANGMSSTADDLLRWTLALRSGTVLSAADWRAIEGPQIFVRRERGEDVYYGYGVRVYMKEGRVTEVMHSGSSDEGNTGIVRELDGLTIIVLSTSGDHAGTTWSSYLARRIPVRERNR